MSRKTSTTAGLSKPHKSVAAVPGVGSAMGNTRSINTEQGGRKPSVGKGTPSTYFGNSRACGTARGQYGKDR